MPILRPRIQSFGEGIKKRTKLFGDIWGSRISFAVSQLISARLALGRAHEGESGLLIARFVREIFKSITLMRKINNVAKTDLGRSYISMLVLKFVPDERKSAVLEDLEKLAESNVKGHDFLEGVRLLLKKHLNEDEAKKVSKVLANRLAHVLVGKNTIFDPVESRLYAVNELTGELIVRDINMKNMNNMVELLSYDVFDKKKNLHVQYAEWRMLKVVEEGELKGLKGKALGAYVYARIREELEKDEIFRHCFGYYLAEHYDKLETSRNLMIAFGDLAIIYAKMNRKIVAAMVRAMAQIPFMRSIVEPFVAIGESIDEGGESIRESVKYSKKHKRFMA